MLPKLKRCQRIVGGIRDMVSGSFFQCYLFLPSPTTDSVSKYQVMECGKFNTLGTPHFVLGWSDRHTSMYKRNLPRIDAWPKNDLYLYLIKRTDMKDQICSVLVASHSLQCCLCSVAEGRGICFDVSAFNHSKWRGWLWLLEGWLLKFKEFQFLVKEVDSWKIHIYSSACQHFQPLLFHY